MYDVIVLFKPAIDVKVKNVVELAEAITADSEAKVVQDKNVVSIELGEAKLTLDFSNDASAREEVQEIADLFEVDCAGCKSRVTMGGYDPEMMLIDDYNSLIERLSKNQHVILFDPVEGALLEP
ncbi:MAG: hypothetical protein AAF703_20450 [Cyanobacteria bacterium P01_D01_bin.105]